MKNLSELNFIWEVSQTLSCNIKTKDIENGLNNVFSNFLDVQTVNIIFYDFAQNRLCDFTNPKSLLANKEVEKYEKVFKNLSSTMRLNFMLNDKLFVIDDDFNLSYKISLDGNKNIFYIPLINNYNCFGFIEIVQNKPEEKEITKDMIKMLFIVTAQISAMVMNKQLNDKITRIADFYKAQKNIAKILETQYEYSFLIPLKHPLQH